MSWSVGLTGVHRQIAEANTTPIHVLAGPGTGKTFAMMRRVARLLETGTNPSDILAITFTRTAAKDLRDQLVNLGVVGADRVRASTIHSLCFGVLSQEKVFEATARHARPLLSHEAEQLINDLADRFGGKRRARALLKAYEAGWARLQRDPVRPPSEQEDAAFEAEAISWLRYHRSILVGELVPLTLYYLRDNPVQEAIPPYRHLLVDEYQDLNRADQVLIETFSRNGELTVIGDDNQSIYSFRYANPDAIGRFPDEHPGTASFQIAKCRRCPPNIVEMSNRLISYNPHRTREVPLQTDPGRPVADVSIVQHESIDNEVGSIADFIAEYLRRNPGVSHGQVLVLATRRFIGHRIRSALINRGLNSLSYFVEDALDSTGAAEGFTLLTLLVRPNDRTALRAWIGLGSESGYARSYCRIREYCAQSNQDLRETLDQLAVDVLAVPYCKPIAIRHRKLLDRLAALEKLRGLDLVRQLWAEDDEPSLDIRLAAEAIALTTPDPAEILDALQQQITQPTLPGSDGDIIRVMSLYKSKGLTARVTVIAGCMAGVLPKIDPRLEAAEQDAEVEEQRRLFYVAITRATHVLVISSSVKLLSADAHKAGVHIRRFFNTGGQAWAVTSASPFIRELGAVAPRAITTAEWRLAARLGTAAAGG